MKQLYFPGFEREDPIQETNEILKSKRLYERRGFKVLDTLFNKDDKIVQMPSGKTIWPYSIPIRLSNLNIGNPEQIELFKAWDYWNACLSCRAA